MKLFVAMSLALASLGANAAPADGPAAGAHEKASSSPALAPSAAPFLWQVDGPKARHYLLGSVHMLPESAYPLPAALESAYAATRGIVFESDLEALSSPDLQGKLLGAAKDDRQGGLKAAIGKTLYARLQKHAAKLGMPTPVCEGLRAWFCAMTLELYPMQLAGYEAELGIDQHFYAKALEDGRNATWLEAPETQLDVFVGMTDAMSTQFLAATLDDVSENGLSPEEMLRTWRTGDNAAMEKLVKDMRTRYPEIYARMLADRNRAWLPKLVERLSGSEPQLVIVGAAHLQGPDGLVAQLKAQNFNVTPATAVSQSAFAPSAKDAPKLSWVLTVHDVEPAVSFYERAFAFEAIDQSRNDQNQVEYARLKHRDAAILLMSEAASHRLAPASGKITPPSDGYLYVDDVDAFVARAKSAGAELLEAPSLRAWGDRVAVVRDPEGYFWMLAQCAGSGCRDDVQPRAPQLR